MTDLIIIIILIAVLALAIKPSIQHFKGEGGCCGGGNSVKHKHKKLQNVVVKRTVLIEGMSCEHCKNRVEEAIDAIDGAAGRVNLKKKAATVLLEKEISDEKIMAAIANAGYKVTEIREG